MVFRNENACMNFLYEVKTKFFGFSIFFFFFFEEGVGIIFLEGPRNGFKVDIILLLAECLYEFTYHLPSALEVARS